MISINRIFTLPPVFLSPEMDRAQKKLSEFYQSDPSLRRQQRFSDTFIQKFRNDFLPILREEFNCKCAYCESNINLATTHSEYDHFRPKQSARGFDEESSEDHYWWLTYEWRNIYYACTKCNTYKSTWFPVDGPRAPVQTPHDELQRYEQNLLIDPCNDDPAEHLRYDLTGRLINLTSQGLATIELIKLNRTELVQERRAALDKAMQSFSNFEAMILQEPIDVPALNAFFSEWREIFSGRSKAPYLGIQRYFIYEWLKKYDLHDYLINRDFVMPADEQLAEYYKDQNTTPQVFDFDLVVPIERSTPAFEKKLENIRHVFIERMELHNFKCFEDLTVNFFSSDSINSLSEENEITTNEPWILFLGENGVGKSSLLKAFAIGLAGREYLKSLDLKGSELLRHGAESGYIKLHLVGGIVPAIVLFTKDEITCNIDQPIVSFVAYNAIRLKRTLPYIVPEDATYYGAKARNLFDYTKSLIDCDNWLSIQNKESFDRIALTLKDLLSLDNEDEIILIEYQTALRRGGKVLYIDELSDGYQSIFYLAIDIMATIQLDGLPYELAEGMIIIDEIGAHLHPRWRMEVVGKLRRAFPKMRFVVSTHEPLCLRGIKAGETVVLQKDEENKFILLTDLPNPAEMRIDQILTSDFFGLNSTMDSETEKHFNEYYELLAQDEATLSPEGRERLAELRTYIPKIRNLGNSVRENIIYEVVDRLLAEKKAYDPFRTVKSIKQEAFLRLQKIWNNS